MPRDVIHHPKHNRFRSLGWIGVWWIETFVRHGRGGAQGMPIRYGDEYTSFIVDCYALDETGRRLYDSAFFSRPKGTDKSGVAAALCLLEAFGPCRFAGWAKGGETYEFLGETYVYEPGEPMGKPQHNPMIRILATEEGQPLALDTPVLTADGWSTIGEVQVGDYVFGSDGRPVRVERTTQVFTHLDCYEIEFSDGEKFVASGSHLWTLERSRLKDRKKEVVTVSTEEIADTYLYSGGASRYRLEVTPAFQMPEKELLIDPYFLGLWLGDGKSRDSSIAFDYQDREWMTEWAEGSCDPGETAVVSEEKDGTGYVRFKRSSRTEDHLTRRSRLRELGVLNNKHVPDDYLNGSVEQRMSLLQGLMDSDGTIDARKGRAMFTNTNRAIIDGIEELLTGLGYKWNERYDKSVDAWRVLFQPTSDRPVTRLPRKVERHRVVSGHPRSRYRYIVSVKRVPTVPVKCLGIDNEDHLFAAGRGMVLTHNTGNTYDSIYYNLTTEDAPLYQLRAYGLDVGLTRVILHTGGEIVPSSTGASSKDGGLETFVVLDETHLHNTNKLRDMYTTVTRNSVKRRKEGAWYLETTTMYAPGEESMAEKTYEFAQLIKEGKAHNERLLFDHRYAIVPDIHPMKIVVDGIERTETQEEYLKRLEDSFREAYGDAIAWNDVQGLLDSLFDPRNSVTSTYRYFFNALVATSDAWVDPQHWKKNGLKYHLDECRNSGKKPEWFGLRKGEKIALGFDGGRTDDATVLIACRISDGLIAPIKIWEAPDTAEAEDWSIDHAEVDSWVDWAHDEFEVVAFFADPPLWQDYVDKWAAKYGESYVVKASPGSAIEFWTSRASLMIPALERIHTAIALGEMRHTDHPVLTRHVLNARRRERPQGTLIGKERKKSPKKIDAAIGMTLAYEARARYLLKHKPEAPVMVPRRVR